MPYYTFKRKVFLRNYLQNNLISQNSAVLDWAISEFSSRRMTESQIVKTLSTTASHFVQTNRMEHSLAFAEFYYLLLAIRTLFNLNNE
jgi:hypothetical protein